MNYTQNYQLTQWEKADRIVMADFNSDNAKLDAALRTQNTRITTEAARLDGRIDTESARLEGLSATTPRVLANITLSGAAQSRTVSLPGGLSQYYRLRFLCLGGSSDYNAGPLAVCVNGSTDSSKYCNRIINEGSNSHAAQGIQAGTLGSSAYGGGYVSVDFYPGGNCMFAESRCIWNVGGKISEKAYQHLCTVCGFSGLSYLLVKMENNSGSQMAAGTKLLVLGYKA